MRAVWSELLPYSELATPPVLDMLGARELGLYVAVMPDTLSGIGEVVRACRLRGIRVGVWPMLSDDEGRWPSLDNVERFVDFVAEVRAATDADELVLDLEPPIDVVRALLRWHGPTIRRQLRRPARPDGTRLFRALAASVEADGIATLSAAFPLVLADHREGWQRFLGTPVDSIRTTWVSAMLYTSILEGTSRGVLRRGDVLALLGAGARAALARYGSRASISLGAVGTGALGDEPTYRDIFELAEDVAVVRGAGIEHIVLFSLCGAIRRGAPERWLDALVHTPPAAPPPWTARAAATSALAMASARLMNHLTDRSPTEL